VTGDDDNPVVTNRHKQCAPVQKKIYTFFNTRLRKNKKKGKEIEKTSQIVIDQI